ncbi:MAG: Kelch repeat-containing protein, partial [Candidatus Uhrbacteria bacterium GW2011_GWF2_44_350]
MRKFTFLFLSFLISYSVSFSQNVKKTNQTARANTYQPSTTVNPTVIRTALDFKVTIPLSEMPTSAEVGPLTPEQIEEFKKIKKEHKLELNAPKDVRNYPFFDPSAGPDPAWQQTMGTKSISDSKAPLLNFAGQTCGASPPDCNGAAGPNHFMQAVNSTYVVYNKSGVALTGMINFNTLFNGVAGASRNDGDPIVLYDEQADRWLVAEFSLDGTYGATTDRMLVAVSTTNNPLGTWYAYSFDVDDMPDYMKFGVWQDGYYMATNNSTAEDVYVFERSVMLAGGASPQMVGFDNPNRPASGFHCIMPLDNDGAFAPAGEPGQFITINDGAWGGADQLWIYELDVNWTTPASSTFARTQTIGVNAFDSNFGATWDNIGQPGTAQEVDAIPQILMFRAQYRNWGTNQTIVCAHTVDVDNTDRAGIRWYELQNTGTTWSVRQQGTYSPSADDRWIPSIAMDANHNIGLGYNVANTTSIYPSIRYCGQSATENAAATGVMDIAEESIIAGTSSKTDNNRWGDYAEMCLDPTNDLTFWFTSQYSNGAPTRIATFQFAPITTPPNTNFTINTPNTIVRPVPILQGSSATFTDLTTGTVDSYLWAFESGTPATATTQNPGTITYNTVGEFNVSLTTSNIYGDSTLTRQDYIKVYSTTAETCDTLVQFIGNPTIYTSTNGYVGGTNEYGCAAISEKFTDVGLFNEVYGGRFYWAAANNGTSPNVTFVMWAPDASGNPGTQLATTTIPLATIVNDYNTVGYTDVNFGSEIPIPTDGFFIGFLIPGTPASGDTLAILTNNDINSADNTGYSLYGTTWETYDAWTLSLMNAIIAFACYDPFLPPVANFSGTPTTVMGGSTVAFTDLSYGGTPTSWSWTFVGGTPGTATTQNPTITYNTPGYYAVTLTATNANGSDSETKTNYIHVLDPNACNCSQLDHVVGNEVVYTTTGGYLSGSNEYADKVKAEYFADYAPFTRVEGVYIRFGAVHVANTATNITINLYDDNGAASGGGTHTFSPGTVLATKTVPITTIAADVAAGDTTYIDFTTPVTITGPFFIGFVIPTPSATSDSIAVMTGVQGAGTDDGWEQWSDNVWYSYTEAGWGGSFNNAIYPAVCSMGSPLADFTANTTTVGAGQSVTFTDMSYCTPTSWSWTLP